MARAGGSAARRLADGAQQLGHAPLDPRKILVSRSEWLQTSPGIGNYPQAPGKAAESGISLLLLQQSKLAHGSARTAGGTDIWYAELTRDTKEPLKRLAHASRLQRASEMVPLRREMKVLDYGCGDGALFEFLSRDVPVEKLIGFDPWMANEVEIDGVTVYDNTDDLLRNHANSFDVVFCLEVCEHLTQDALNELFHNLRKLGKEHTRFVFSAPIETGFSGFAKNIYRTLMANRQHATVGRAIKSLLSIPIPRVHDEEGWIYSHLGFDWRHFTVQLHHGGFTCVRRDYLPWKPLGTFFNNEIYFICQRNDQHHD